jgi:hypothetical protein
MEKIVFTWHRILIGAGHEEATMWLSMSNFSFCFSHFLRYWRIHYVYWHP